MGLKRRHLYLPSLLLMVSLLFTGIIFDFDYFKQIDVQLHDTYFLILPVNLSMAAWIILVFIAYTIKVFKEYFSNRISLIILLIANSLIFVITLAITYMIYVFFGLEVMADLFKYSSQSEILHQQEIRTMSICFLFLFLILSIEVILIRKIIWLK